MADLDISVWPASAATGVDDSWVWVQEMAHIGACGLESCRGKCVFGDTEIHNQLVAMLMHVQQEGYTMEMSARQAGDLVKIRERDAIVEVMSRDLELQVEELMVKRNAFPGRIL